MTQAHSSNDHENDVVIYKLYNCIAWSHRGMARMLTNGLNAKLRLSGWFCRPDFSLQAFERIEKGQYSIISSSCVIHITVDKMENLRRRNLRRKFSVTILWLKDVFIEWYLYAAIGFHVLLTIGSSCWIWFYLEWGPFHKTETDLA